MVASVVSGFEHAREKDQKTCLDFPASRILIGDEDLFVFLCGAEVSAARDSPAAPCTRVICCYNNFVMLACSVTLPSVGDPYKTRQAVNRVAIRRHTASHSGCVSVRVCAKLLGAAQLIQGVSVCA